MVSLIVEDGTGVANANSYNSVDDLIEYATDRGVILVPGSPENDATKVAIMAINAMDYLNLFRYKWKGQRTNGEYRLDWPRKYVYLGNDIVAIPDNTIPGDIKDAQAALCMAIAEGIKLLPSSGTDAFITREKIGPLETQYSEAVRMAAGALPDMPSVNLLIDAYLDGGFKLRSVRI